MLFLTVFVAWPEAWVSEEGKEVGITASSRLYEITLARPLP